jgi:hypothetical protein
MRNKLFTSNLKQRIEIYENVILDDLNDNWVKKQTFFAGIKHITANLIKFFEGVDFGNLINENYLLFSIRFNKDINKSMRILFKGKYFLIKKITNVLEQDKILEIIAMEVS